ncbi:MAG: hypothetical protein ABI877_20015, partial [Gemmatimonadaceae bacterium]
MSAACARNRVNPDPRPVPLPTAAPASAAAEPLPNAADLAAKLAAKALMVPVEGVTPERVADTYSALRAAGTHRAIDIIAPRGTPVLAADAGRVFRLRTNP